MTVCEHVRLDLGGYVLGALEDDEAAAVARHLTVCSRCAAEHARLAGLPELLALAEGVEDLPAPAPGVEERVLDAFAREHPRPARRARLRRRAGWLRPRILLPAAAGLAAVLIALVLALAPTDESAGPGYRVALNPVAGQSATGTARLESVAGGTALRLAVHGLPADPSVVYEVRCDAPDWTASAGTFRTDAHGTASVLLTTAARRGEYDAIRVVRRSHGGTTNVMTAAL
jgi:hypothetical protein